jgi:hypothetical protein
MPNSTVMVLSQARSLTAQFSPLDLQNQDLRRAAKERDTKRGEAIAC